MVMTLESLGISETASDEDIGRVVRLILERRKSVRVMSMIDFNRENKVAS